MSAAILQFPERRKVALAPTPAKIDITEAECRLLDSTKAIVDRVLDVVNTDQKLIRGFLAAEKMIQATFKHNGVEYNVRVSLELSDVPGPRVA
jgi:phosphoribosylamine-glycine ligase